MGATYLVVNTTKRQFFDPDVVGVSENTKAGGILWGLSGHALAQLLFLNGPRNYHLTSWVGDTFFLFGDGDESTLPRELLELGHDSEEPIFQLVVRHYADISLNLLAALCERTDLCQHYVACSEHNDQTYVALCQVLTSFATPRLEATFVDRFGQFWRKRMQSILRHNPHDLGVPWHGSKTARPDDA